MYKITFKDVGRNKANWEMTVDELDDKKILPTVRSKGMIMSSEIDLPYGPETKTGAVFVGGWRQVGSFTVEELKGQ